MSRNLANSTNVTNAKKIIYILNYGSFGSVEELLSFSPYYRSWIIGNFCNDNVSHYYYLENHNSTVEINIMFRCFNVVKAVINVEPVNNNFSIHFVLDTNITTHSITNVDLYKKSIRKQSTDIRNRMDYSIKCIGKECLTNNIRECFVDQNGKIKKNPWDDVLPINDYYIHKLYLYHMSTYHNSYDSYEVYCNKNKIRETSAREFINKNFHEILKKACHPRRSVFSWNEGAAEEYPEEYAAECEYYRHLVITNKDRRPFTPIVMLNCLEFTNMLKYISNNHKVKKKTNTWFEFTIIYGVVDIKFGKKQEMRIKNYAIRRKRQTQTKIITSLQKLPRQSNAMSKSPHKFSTYSSGQSKFGPKLR